MKNSILNPQSIIITIFTILFFVVVIFGDMK